MLNPLQYRINIAAHGTSVRVWRAVPGDYNMATNYVGSGAPLTWQELTIPTGAKALVHDVKRRVNHEDMGWITISELALTTMPDEIPIAHLDRVLLTGWEISAREPVERGVDTLRYAYLSELSVLTLSRIVRVSQGATTYANPTDYTVSAQGAIVWKVHKGPAAGTQYAVDYYYHPLYRFMGGEQDVSRPSGFDAAVIPGLAAGLPIGGVLQWERAGET